MLSRCRTSGSLQMASMFSKQVQKGTAAMPKLHMFNTGRVMQRHLSMMSLESSLPRLPVPPLHQTMDKYLKAIEALVDKEEFENSRNIVKEFSKPGGAGEMLQKELEGYAKKKDNWLIDWWNNIGYLEQRVPLPIYFSPATTFPKETFQDKLSHLKYATRIISNTLKFKEQIDNETLSIDMMGKEPLNMEQYKVLFGGIRVPRHNRDEFVQAPSDKSRHIIVAHNNQFYVFDVLDADGRPLSESELLTQLMRIVENIESLEHPVGVLTSNDRSSWAAQSKAIRRDKQNKVNIELISCGQFVVCLDKPPVPSTQSPSIMEDATNSVTARQALHGDGIDSNSMNRWYDKTINYCVSEDGHCGCVYEHTPAEAPPVGRLWDFVIEHRGSYESISPSTSNSNLPHPLKLKWNLGPSSLEAIEKAKYNIESLIDDLDVRCFKFEHYGKDFIKSQKLSPDAWIQMSFQLTHYRLHGEIGPAYESASIRKFYRARTENTRSSSMPTLQFVQGMADPSLTNSDRLKLMRNAVSAHHQYTKEALNGQGIDRHLFGLKRIAIESGITLPDLFLDPSYSYMQHFKISTSQVPIKAEGYVVYGPSVPDGYGVCYNPHPTKMMFGISTFNSNPITNSGHFASYLRRSLDDMRLLATTSKL